MEFPEQLRYTKEHEWVAVEGGRARVALGRGDEPLARRLDGRVRLRIEVEQHARGGYETVSS